VKERLVTLALAICALALFWILLVPKPRPAAAAAPRPLTTGADGEGYFAAARWLTAAGVPTLALHKRYAQLRDVTISAQPTGNLLITTMPYGVVLNPEEYSALDGWIGAGNTVLILAGLDDTPVWSALSTNFVPELQRIAGIEFKPVQAPTADSLTKAKAGLVSVLTPGGGAIELHPSGRIGLLEGIRHLATLSPLPSQQWQAKALDELPVLELARRMDSADPVLWVRNSGNGAIIVSAYASLFNNQLIGSMDNARLLSNIVAWSLQPGGRVIFDDAHQGAMDEYDAGKFFADPRLHRTLLWLLALWLVWVLASQPLRAAAGHSADLDEGALLRMTARFFAGALRPGASAQWMLDEFFDRLRGRHGLASSNAPPWDWLAAHAGVPGGLLVELRDLYARNQGGRRVSLVRLQQILSQLSGQTS
jgi:cbb3-type cytochrome oxidase subunit 3